MITKAVFSIWTKPDNGDILKSATNWYRPDFMLYSWVLAVNYARKWFDEVELVTDLHGKDILVDRMKLPFTSVRTDLEDLEYDGDFWSAGKIKAYEIQDKPFIHIDYDCILFKKLPDYALTADLFAQNIEDHGWFESAYRPEYNIVDKWKKLPPSWVSDRKNEQAASCLGIVGGHDLKTIKQYCKEVWKLLDNKEWDNITNKGSYCIVFEQYLFNAVCNRLNKKITYLSEPAMDKQYLEDIGYCHIWGDKKREDVYRRCIKRVLNEYPEYINRIKNIKTLK